MSAIVLDDSDPFGTEAITILVAIRDALSAAGDERFPITRIHDGRR